MASLRRDIATLGMFAATHELLDLGHSQSILRVAVRRQQIIRVRKGWYCLPEVADRVQRAARVGGRLTCVSAALEHDLWIPPHPDALHVSVTPNSCQLRSTRDYRTRLRDYRGERAVIHWDDGAGPSRLEVEPPGAIAEICRCMPLLSAFILCESALYTRYLSWGQWQVILAGLPALSRRALAAVGSRSESGAESAFLFGMLEENMPVRQQVWIGPDRVDFLIGACLVVEIDSVAYHDPTVDCLRDARLGIRGYRVLRFMYSQVIGDWSTVRAAVLAAILRGDHQR